jgi:hypothetical protein
MPSETTPTASSRALATPEIAEHIFLDLLEDLTPPTNRDDWRSTHVQSNARILLHLLRCSQVSLTWRRCIFNGPPFLQRALFLRLDPDTHRSWDQHPSIYPNQQSYYRGIALRAPILNPVIQTACESYKFRYWRSGLGAEGPRHHAYMIITRSHSDKARRLMDSGFGAAVRRMFLSQPPPTEMGFSIWERDDKEALFDDRTTAISEPYLGVEGGVTLDDVLQHAGKLFDSHPDLVSLKITTI